jgi:hypothetical protein
VSSVDLTHSENHQRHLSRPNCWKLDQWKLGGPVVGVNPLARPENLPSSSDVISLEAAVSSIPLSQNSSDIRFRDRNLRFLETPPPPLMTADKRIFSPAKWQRSEMPYYFSCIITLLLQSSLFIFVRISNTNEIITQWSLPTRLINFSITY